MRMTLKCPNRRGAVKIAQIHFAAYLWLAEEYKEVTSLLSPSLYHPKMI